MKEIDVDAPLTALEAVACSVMLPVADMMEWQRRAISCKAREIWFNKHRQGGVTKKVWTIRIMLHSLRLQELGAKGEDWYWVSRDIFTAREFIAEFRKMWEPIGLISKAGKGINIMRIRLPCGGWLNAMSSSPNALVGKTGNIVFDEFAIHNDQEKLWSIGAGGTMHGFILAAISTPRGKNTFHAQQIEKIKNGTKSAYLIEIDLLTSISQGLVRIINRGLVAKGEPPLTDEEFIKQCKERSASEELYNQEYMCIPSSGDSSSAITEDDMKRVMIDCTALGFRYWDGKGGKEKIPKPPAGGREYYAGIDVGNVRDLTVVWIAEMLSTGQMVTRCLLVLPAKQDWDIKAERILAILKAWRPRKVKMDVTNCPDFGARIAKQYPVTEGFIFSSVNRKIVVGHAIREIKRQQFLVPDRNEIGKDFCAVEVYRDKYGNQDYMIPSRRVAGEETAHDGGHSDRFMAAALCMDAGRERAESLQIRTSRSLAVKRVETVTPPVSTAAQRPAVKAAPKPAARPRRGGGY